MKQLALLALSLFVAGAGLRAEERSFDGWKEAVIWIARPDSNIEASLKGFSFAFDLDFPMQGALALADQNVVLSTQPKALRLSLREPDGLLKAQVVDGELKFVLGKDPQAAAVASIKIEPGKGVTRLAVRQLDQVALYVVSSDGKTVTQVWCGQLDYRIKLRSADIYELCDKVEVRMGDRKFETKDLPKGLVLDHMDELGDLVIQGIDPQKKPFVHRYTFDLKLLDDKLNGAFNTLFPGLKEKESKEGKEPKESKEENKKTDEL